VDEIELRTDGELVTFVWDLPIGKYRYKGAALSVSKDNIPRIGVHLENIDVLMARPVTDTGVKIAVAVIKHIIYVHSLYD